MGKASIAWTVLRQPAARLVAVSGIVFVVIAWFTVVWQIVEDQSTAANVALRENRQRVVAFGQYVRNTFEAADLAAIYLDARYGGGAGNGMAGAPRAILLPGECDSVVVGAHIVDPGGTVRATTGGARAVEPSIRSVAQELRTTDAMMRAISNPVRRPGSTDAVLIIGRAMRDAQGAFAGAVIVEVPVRRFVDFDIGLDGRPADLISMVSLRGISLARREAGVISSGQDVSGTLIMQRQRTRPDGDYWNASIMDGKRRLFSHYRLPDYGIFVTSGVGEQDILGPAMRRAGWFVSLAAALTLVVGALLALYFRHLANAAQAQRRFDQLRDEFAHSARVASLSEMAAGLAHELNQPLTAASNYLAVGELMNRGEGSRDAVATQLQQVRGQIARAGDIIRRIRDYLSKGSAELRSEALGPVIDDAIELARGGNAARRGRIVYFAEEAQTRVLIDRIQIQQVLVNLIRNAEEAMAYLPADRSEIRIACAQVSDAMLEIRVDDNGPGFPDSVREHFNLPFISTKAEHGLGIGLSICRRIIEVHGGSLRVWNRASGASAAFTVKRDVGVPAEL
ncbi:ATP-binding protein [Sphingomonas sp.]|uniref:ATP-binding protein n=1 Tax=Sphingomonas sp. TaxID=28214 RepID=UPI003BADA87F